MKQVDDIGLFFTVFGKNFYEMLADANDGKTR
jgi:hypothetical protein